MNIFNTVRIDKGREVSGPFLLECSCICFRAPGNPRLPKWAHLSEKAGFRPCVSICKVHIRKDTWLLEVMKHQLDYEPPESLWNIPPPLRITFLILHACPSAPSLTPMRLIWLASFEKGDKQAPFSPSAFLPSTQNVLFSLPAVTGCALIQERNITKAWSWLQT